jgi:hypothetical protein
MNNLGSSWRSQRSNLLLRSNCWIRSLILHDITKDRFCPPKPLRFCKCGSGPHLFNHTGIRKQRIHIRIAQDKLLFVNLVEFCVGHDWFGHLENVSSTVLLIALRRQALIECLQLPLKRRSDVHIWMEGVDKIEGGLQSPRIMAHQITDTHDNGSTLAIDTEKQNTFGLLQTSVDETRELIHISVLSVQNDRGIRISPRIRKVTEAIYLQRVWDFESSTVDQMRDLVVGQEFNVS